RRRIPTLSGAGSAPGAPHVCVLETRRLRGPAAELAGFHAHDPAFAGGVRSSVCDVDGDGRGEIVTRAEAGGGRACARSGAPPTGRSPSRPASSPTTRASRAASASPGAIAAAGGDGGPPVRGFAEPGAQMGRASGLLTPAAGRLDAVGHEAGQAT